MLTIGNVTLDSNVILSPMAGFSDVALRVLSRRNGAGLVCTEMVNATAVNRDVARTQKLMLVLDQERPTCIQIFGSKPEEVSASCKKVEANCDIVGFNFGCPAYQIKAAGCGAALLDHPDTVEALVRTLRASTKKPLLIKMRLGNMGRADFVGVARRIEAAGADALIVHGRTAKDGYAGHADWEAIRVIKQAIRIPVIANGDVVDGPSAKKCLDVTGADGIAIGRAALGDPGVFQRINAYLKDGTVIPAPTPAQKIAMFNEYCAIANLVGIDKAQLVQQAMTFTKGIPGGARLRERLASGAIEHVSITV